MLTGALACLALLAGACGQPARADSPVPPGSHDPFDTLEMTADDAGVSPAPINGDDLKAKVSIKGAWPVDRPHPEVLEKSLWVHWTGRAHSAKGHALPMLYVRIKLAVPAGSGLSTHADKPLVPQHLMNDVRDAYTFEVPITRLVGNHVELFLRGPDATPAEFAIEYDLKLDATVAGVHSSCTELGVRLRELSRVDKRHGFFFVSCVREDRMLYVNVLKPADLKASDGATGANDVIRVPMPPEQTPRHEKLADLGIYELTFDSDGPVGFRLAFGLAPAYYAYSDDFPRAANSLRQFQLLGLASLGYVFAPGHWEIDVEAKGTIVSSMLTSSILPAANFYSLGYNLGYALPFAHGSHAFNVALGWYHYFMTVPGQLYGMPRQGFSNLSGPQLTLGLRFNPLGRLGWKGYFRFALLSNTTQGLDFGRLQQHDATLGVAVDLPLFEGHLRRPAVFLEGGLVAVSLNEVDMNENHLMLGVLYPIR